MLCEQESHDSISTSFTSSILFLFARIDSARRERFIRKKRKFEFRQYVAFVVETVMKRVLTCFMYYVWKDSSG